MEAGNPLGDFFKRVGNSIAHPQHAKSSRRPVKPGTVKAPISRGQPGETATAGGNIAAVSGGATSVASATPSTVSSALRTPQSNGRRDLPYGVPVPNKPGLVTSPYSPMHGFVDVRGFASGTEVKDPYTNKVFLVP